MDTETQERIKMLELKIDAVYVSVEKTRKYILTMAIISIATIVLPLIALVFIIPMVLGALNSAYSGLL